MGGALDWRREGGSRERRGRAPGAEGAGLEGCRGADREGCGQDEIHILGLP